jgi:hypothetical protein
MNVSLYRRVVFACASLLVGGALAAQPGPQEDIPLRNWPVPARSTDGGGELRALTDISPGVGFVAMQPCRVVDTRGGGPFTGQYGPPIMLANATRNFDINSAPHCTGIPANAEAYSLNFTVTQTVASGDIRAWPQDNPPVQITSVLNWQGANVTIANATIIPAGTGGGITVQVAGANTHLLIDINGYFTAEYNTNVSFQAIGNNSAQTGLFSNLSIAAATYGVTGSTASVDSLAAGVKGVAGDGPPTIVSNEPHAGVVGVSKFATGVFGLSQFIGAQGHIHDEAGNNLGTGRLGYTPTAGTNYGVYSDGDAHVQGTFTATTKSFVEPHPLDASKEIRYISVEAPSAEIYFRGTSQISQGLTRIDVPEHFRLVARPGSYATMVTPVGSMATVAVVSEDENGIVIRASRNVKVHYVVYAERNSFAGLQPVVENVHFRPDQDGSFGLALPESYRQLLIQNKSLNPDGTLNKDTAKRLGWKLPEESAGK